MKVQKLSLTLPGNLVEEARVYAPDCDLSAYVADGLYRRVLSDRLGRYLRELDEECGPLAKDELKAAERMWKNAR
jgi:hypothetical protein